MSKEKVFKGDKISFTGNMIFGEQGDEDRLGRH